MLHSVNIPNRFDYPSKSFSNYWKQKIGKKMLTSIDRIPNTAEIKSHVDLFYKKDDLADAVIEEVTEKYGFVKTLEYVNILFSNKGFQEKEIPQSLKKLYLEFDHRPNWVNDSLLEKGSNYCRRVSTAGLIVLRNYCLMGGYESSAINKPLIFTGALKKGAAKRMAETVEFWVNITRENALIEKGAGLKTIFIVRLIHAHARCTILKSKEWENKDWGIPLNQWDMLATNLGFSIVFAEGLKMLGLAPTKEEMKGLLHFWKYTGYLLGIPEALLPNTEEEAIKELYKWTISQPKTDQDTITLAQALEKEPLLSNFGKYKMTKKLIAKINVGYNQFFLGKESCHSLKLPKTIFILIPFLSIPFHKLINFLSKTYPKYYQKRVEIGGNKQEKVKHIFMKGHSL